MTCYTLLENQKAVKFAHFLTQRGRQPSDRRDAAEKKQSVHKRKQGMKDADERQGK